MTRPPIGRYERLAAEVHEWDPRVIDVASRVAAIVNERRPRLDVQHIGSTAVPGLPGKGIVDLAAQVEPVDVPAVTELLLGLGFQRQPGPDPWPASRPMLVGALEHDGESFRIHFHVEPRGHRVFGGGYEREIRFRDALRADPGLVREYAEMKRAIVSDSPDGRAEALAYTHAKTAWIRDVYRRMGMGLDAVLPPATIGILGGGQLGRMLGLAARELGYRIAVLDPDPHCPAAAVAEHVEVGGYDDVAAAGRLGERSDVVTYELEHVSAALVDALEEQVPVRPGGYPLRVTQDRLAERRFLARYAIPSAPWREVVEPIDVRAAAEELGLPLRLKAAVGGYDGRRQLRIATGADVARASERLRADVGGAAIAERDLDFETELSVIVARGLDGSTRAYPVARNRHDGGILVETVVPAPVLDVVAAAAVELAERMATYLGLVGLLTVELFLMPDGSLVVNELAPRVHNSGHWTIEGAATSQFEQHVRAICGLPLGGTEPLAPAAAMVNLLGVGAEREARPTGVDAALETEGAHLHLYDKRLVRERRKMGHVTALGRSVDEALATARAAAARLGWA